MQYAFRILRCGLGSRKALRFDLYRPNRLPSELEIPKSVPKKNSATTETHPQTVTALNGHLRVPSDLWR
jgi:hypothetical protein